VWSTRTAYRNARRGAVASARLPRCVFGSERATFPDARCAAASSVDPRFEVDSHAWCSSSVVSPLRGGSLLVALVGGGAAESTAASLLRARCRRRLRCRAEGLLLLNLVSGGMEESTVALCSPPRIVPFPRARRRRTAAWRSRQHPGGVLSVARLLLMSHARRQRERRPSRRSLLLALVGGILAEPPAKRSSATSPSLSRVP
jgi:hypothetical protein